MGSKITLSGLVLCAFISTGTAFFNPDKPAITLSPEVIKMLTSEIIKCAKEVGINPNIMEAIKANKIKETYKLKSFVFCGYQAVKASRPDGHLNVEILASYFPKSIKIWNAIKQCDRQGKDPIDTNFKAFKCLQKNFPYHIEL